MPRDGHRLDSLQHEFQAIPSSSLSKSSVVDVEVREGELVSMDINDPAQFCGQRMKRHEIPCSVLGSGLLSAK